MVIIFNTEGFIILSSQVFLLMHFVLSNILITYTMQKNIHLFSNPSGSKMCSSHYIFSLNFSCDLDLQTRGDG